MRHLTAFLMVIFLMACDKIEQPVLENPNDIVDPTAGLLQWDLCPDLIPADYVFPDFAPLTDTQKNVLLEDYTGHSCANCPAAADVAEALEESHPGMVFVASVHAGPGDGFQTVTASYPTDFTTEAGDAYISFPDPEIFGNPAGTVNRIGGGPTGGIWYLPGSWQSLVEGELSQTAKANIALEYYHCPVGNGLFIHADIEVEESLDAADYRFILFLLRQKVISPQSAGSQYIPDYEHHNVLSDNVNGTWGTALQLDTLALDSPLFLNYSYQLPDPLVDATYEISNLAILGFLMDRTTQAVFQSEFIELE
jgi:hypothetical protein